MLYIKYRSGIYLIWYILLFNLPIILIILYLFTHNKKPAQHEPIHFEKKPRSCYSMESIINRVILCEDPKLFAIDEYTDEIESTSSLSARSAFCWRDLVYKQVVPEEIPVDASIWVWLKMMFHRYLSRKRTVQTIIRSRLGYLSTMGGVVNIVSKNGKS